MKFLNKNKRKVEMHSFMNLLYDFINEIHSYTFLNGVTVTFVMVFQQKYV